MRGSRLTPWIVVVGLSACTSNGDRTQGARPGDASGAGGSHATTTSTTGATAGGGAAGNAADAGGTAGASVSDAAGEVRREVHDEASTIPVPCVNNRASLGGDLRAGGATPAAFADAYNAELDSLLGPGPFLMILLGVNDAAPGKWMGEFGPLDPGAVGAGARFAGSHAEVRYSMGAARSVQIPPTDASFDLRFSPPASDALVPVVSIELSGTLTVQCGSLAMTTARFLVPATASSVSFHGSTVGALMGAPTETWHGQAANAWVLELTGTVKEVYAPGALDDGGTE